MFRWKTGYNPNQKRTEWRTNTSSTRIRLRIFSSPDPQIQIGRFNSLEIGQKIDYANLHFRDRGQKAYCDGDTDILAYTNSCGFWKQKFIILQDFLRRSVFLRVEA